MCHWFTSEILEKFSLIFSFVSLNKVDRPMNVAVVGLGRWGSQYLSLLKKSSRFKVVAAYDNDRQRLENYSKQYGFCAAANLEDLCQNFDVDAIFVLTPTPTHYDIFTKLSRYHIPVYLEKPIAGSPLFSYFKEYHIKYCLSSKNIIYLIYQKF